MPAPAIDEVEDDVDEGVYVKAFKKLPEQSAGTVRFFDIHGEGESFVVYNADAQMAAKDVFKTNSAIRTVKYGPTEEDKKLEYVYLRRSNFENFVRDLLLIKQYRVEVFVNESKIKTKIVWVSKYKASPGNLAQFDDILFSNNESEMTVNNGVMGIRLGNLEKTKTVGIAHVNLNECEIHLLEFADNENLTNLESVLVQLAPKEAVFPSISSQSDEFSTLKKILERNGILVNELKSSEFDSKDVDQDMAKLLRFEKGKLQNVSTLPDFGKKLAVSSLAGAVKYLELLSGESYQNQFKVVPYDFGLFLKLDATACRALHLSQTGNNISLLSTIDKCRTAQGHRLMAQFLRQPLLNKEKLEERFDVVQMLIEDIVLKQSLRDEHLRRVPDCQILARKMLKKKCGLADYYKAYAFLEKLGNMVKDLKLHDSDKKHILLSWFIEPITALDAELSKFKELVETTIDLEMAGKGEYFVRADFDDTLTEYKTGMDKAENEMGSLLIKVAKDLNFEANKSIKLESNSQNGYFFRITNKEEKAIRKHGSKYQMIKSTKGAVGFTTSKLQRLSDTYIQCRSQYETAQIDIVSQVAAVVADYHICFEQLGRILAELDVFCSFAHVSANSPHPYVRPQLFPKGSGHLSFSDLRHPCIESLPDINYIPNDVHFEKEKQNFYIITGPNMGGKSTFLRSVGIAALLAHVGCFVPATAAEISILDAILCRVGANDSLIKGISTFMAEMIEASYILKTATIDSLVIVDELGRGTSTYDGFGLCWAITRHLAKNVGCYGVLATHFHELTSLAEEIPSVANYHVTAVTGQDTLTMLYKIEKGPCDRSFGIHVASYVGFPEDILGHAKAMSKNLEDFCQEEDTDDSEAAVKKRRENKMAGHQVIEEFMGKVRELCKEQADIIRDNGKPIEEADVILQTKVQELLKDVKELATGNPYLQYVLKQGMCSDAEMNDINKKVSPELMDTTEQDVDDETEEGGMTDSEDWYNN